MFFTTILRSDSEVLLLIVPLYQIIIVEVISFDKRIGRSVMNLELKETRRKDSATILLGMYPT